MAREKAVTADGAPAPHKRAGRHRLLTHDQIARAAFDLVDAEGPAALTIGRIARELGVGPMTLYGYVASKEAIVAMLPDLLLADLMPVDRDQPWQAVLEDVYLSIYRRFGEHHHVIQVIAHSPVFGRAQAEVVEAVLECLRGAGFDREDAFALQRTLNTYTVGFALFAIAERDAQSPRPRATWADELDPGEFPRIAELSSLLASEVGEDQYVRGLRRILGAT